MTLENAFISGVHQVALVVRDIDKALEEYTNRMGIGPWWVRLYAPPKLTDMRIRGKEIPYSMKLAIAWTGSTMWELIQPVDGPSIYKEFLDTHGEGLHHLQVRHEGMDFDTAIASFTKRGCPPLMEGRMGESRFAYLQTEGPLKTVLEIVKRPLEYVRPDPDYWYPAPPEQV
jgi:catechol 2,3-dioxygenase-like lactoylglutathione lyase family enzyme